MSYSLKTLLLLLLITILFYAVGSFSANHKEQLPEKAAPNTFVILELFTSQGCSSCPAADAQLKKISAWAKEKHLPVFTLSFHVDYWDHLGWKDNFSDELFTARQYRYARAFSRMNIYTPQMVANGIQQFVGSDQAQCERIVTQSLQKKNQENISIKGNYTSDNDELEIRFEVEDSFSGFVNIALVQKEAEINIKGGENRGRKINYTDIVRSFRQIDWSAGRPKSITLDKPDDLQTKNLKVIIYLQKKVDMKILNAIEAKMLRT